MKNKIKISQLPLETTLKEDSLIPVVQDNSTKAIKSKDLLKEVDSEIVKINEQLDEKVDKNEDGQITLDMLSQGVKDVIRGEAPLTNIGIGGVNTYDLSNSIIRNLCAKELMSFIKTQEGGYMGANLSFSLFSGYYYSLITDLVEGELLNWTGFGKGSAVYGIIFVNSSDDVISKHFVGNDIGGIQYDEFIRVPVGTSKAYFNFKTDGKIKVYRYKLKPVAKGHELQEEIKRTEYELQEEIKRAKYSETHVEPKSLTDATINEREESDQIILTSQNTELLEGKLYSKHGILEKNEDGRYSTIYFKVGKYKKFLLSNYRIGVYGGAFVTREKQWLSSFATDGSNADVKREIPEQAHYIAITVSNSDMYKSVKCYTTEIRYKLKSLVLDDTQEITRHNHWKGKKIGFLGTSVLFGANATKSYAQECANKLGFTLKNFGVPGLAIHTQDNGDKLTYGSLTLTKAEYQAQGKTIPSSPIEYVPGGSYNDYYRTYENVFTEENKDIDLWVYAVTPNNSNFDLKDWNLFDKNNWRYTDDSSFKSHRTTFIGALLFLMDKMYTLNPNARMVLLLDSAFAYPNGKKNFEEIKKQWNMPIIDLWGRINTSPKSLSKLKSKDGTDTHPSTFAHEKMGNMLANEILLMS